MARGHPRLLSRRAALGQVARLGLGAAASMAGVAATGIIGYAPPPSTFRAPLDPRGPVREALYWRTVCAGVQCTLCPYECFLPEGARGRCRVRMNSGGRLVTLVYSLPVAVHVDPIEKKPVFHMLPGSRAFSIATVGCSLGCTFCQNWEISQSFPEQAPARVVHPQEVVEGALAAGCQSVAFTYSEPTVFFEYVEETARLARAAGLRNVLVSCGYINPEPLAALAPLFDIVKIDLKGFDEGFYRRVVKGELRFVLRTLETLTRMGVLVEVVNLIIPTLNDDPADLRRMCRWVADRLGKETPIFFSRFTPQYRMQNLPPTPVETLERALAIAREEGLAFTYIGNVPGHPAESTYCPGCGAVLVRREGFAVLEMNLAGGRCPRCSRAIPGIWDQGATAQGGR